MNVFNIAAVFTKLYSKIHIVVKTIASIAKWTAVALVVTAAIVFLGAPTLFGLVFILPSAVTAVATVTILALVVSSLVYIGKAIAQWVNLRNVSEVSDVEPKVSDTTRAA
jgi:hypothetical protein